MLDKYESADCTRVHRRGSSGIAKRSGGGGSSFSVRDFRRVVNRTVSRDTVFSL